MTVILSGVLGLAVGAAIGLWSLRLRGADAEHEGGLRVTLSAALLAVAFVALTVRYGAGLELVELCSFVAVLLILSLTDLDAYRIPNACIATALAIRVAYLAACCASGAIGFRELWFYAISALGVGVALAVVVIVCDQWLGSASMGGGDLKLFVTAAAYVGWQQSILLVLVACVLGIVSSPLFGGGMRQALGSTKPFPFGPSIALSCLITLLCGEPLVAWYVGML